MSTTGAAGRTRYQSPSARASAISLTKLTNWNWMAPEQHCQIGQDSRGDQEAWQRRARQLFAYAREGRYQIEWVDNEESGERR